MLNANTKDDFPLVAKEKEDYKLTRGVKALIEQAIDQTKSNNCYVLCAVIAQTVEEKYGGLNLEYQLRRMGIETTKQILNKIDIYFHKYIKNT